VCVFDDDVCWAGVGACREWVFGVDQGLEMGVLCVVVVGRDHVGAHVDHSGDVAGAGLGE